ncbi:MFS transporter [Vibrio sinaloensis]|uniref:MFS transporter n=1 Tax=Photobacterium sp. (strain ATCC 43367) TaxID=379097 RepID=UPI0035E4DB71
MNTSAVSPASNSYSVATTLLAGLLLQSNQWQFLFEIMTWLGFISVVWVAFSLPNEKRRSSVSTQQNKTSALRAYAVVLKDRVFVTYLTIAVLAQTLFLYYLSYGPAYLIGQLGMDELGFGQQFTIVATAFLLMNFLAPQIIDRFPTRTLLNAALLLMTLASGLSMPSLYR